MAAVFNGTYGGAARTARQFDYNEDEYMSGIEQYRGTEWYDQLAANPYLTDENSFQADWWTANIAEGLFGDTSKRENWYAEMARNRDEYKAEILKKMQEAKHNSTAAQVQRDQAAGLNPDLTGVSEAGQMSAAPQDENPPGAPEFAPMSENLAAAGQIGTLAMNIFNGIFDFGRMIQQFRSAGLDNDLKELQVFKEGINVVNDSDTGAEPFLFPDIKSAEKGGYKINEDGTVIGPDGQPVVGDGEVDMNDPDYLDHILDSINASIATPKAEKDGLIAANKLFKSPRLRRLVRAVRDNYPKNSAARQELRQTRSQKILEAHKGQAEVYGDTYYDPDPVKYGSNMANFFENVDKEIRRVELGLKRAMKRTADVEADYAEEYYEKDEQGNVIVAQAERNARAAQMALASAQAKIDAIVDQEVDKWSEDLKQKGTWWSSGIRLLLPQIRNALKENYFSDLMKKFNFSQTETSTSSTQGGVTTTTKQIR